jgi:hypothetical protein
MFHMPVEENTYVYGHLFISYNVQFCLIVEYASVPVSTVGEGAKLLFQHGPARMVVKVHLSLHTNKCTSIIYYLKSVLIKIKTLYSLIAPTRFDTTRVIIREQSFFLAKITD